MLKKESEGNWKTAVELTKKHDIRKWWFGNSCFLGEGPTAHAVSFFILKFRYSL